MSFSVSLAIVSRSIVGFQSATSLWKIRPKVIYIWFNKLYIFGSNCGFNLGKTTTIAPLTAEDFFVHISPNATVQEEKRHAISCIPRSPTAKTRWFKENEFIGPPTSKHPISELPHGLKFVSDTTLEIEKMSRHLVGKYTCTIVSTEQSSINATIWIGMSFRNDDCDISKCNNQLASQPP